MDTLLFYPEKRIFNVVGATVNFFMVVAFVTTQSIFLPLMANDLVAKVSNPVFDTGPATIKVLNEFSAETRAKQFDEKIMKKYPKATIINVDKGIKHIKLTKYYDGKPVKINVVEIDKRVASDYTLTPVLASETLNNRRTISSIAQKSNAIVAINGTFFKPQTGVPLGTLMIDKKMYTGPIYDRVAFGVFDDGYDVARVKLNATLNTKKFSVNVDNINQPRMLSTYTLAYTSDWGKYAPPTPKYGMQFAIVDNKITKISIAPLEIPQNGYVIVGPSSKLHVFQEGDKINLDIKTNPEWNGVRHIISGGPYLVKNGEVYVDMTEEKLGAIGGKNPRSAIGYTADNDLILVAVDGREGSSVGMTLMQLANFMKSIGCVGAINLDGGGSTVMYVDGKVVNSPQQTGGIPLSNAVAFTKKI